MPSQQSTSAVQEPAVGTQAEPPGQQIRAPEPSSAHSPQQHSSLNVHAARSAMHSPSGTAKHRDTPASVGRQLRRPLQQLFAEPVKHTSPSPRHPAGWWHRETSGSSVLGSQLALQQSPSTKQISFTGRQPLRYWHVGVPTPDSAQAPEQHSR
jgi:hypothetical protein